MVKYRAGIWIFLHVKWSNFDNMQQNFITFSGMLGEDEKIVRKICVQKF